MLKFTLACTLIKDAAHHRGGVRPPFSVRLSSPVLDQSVFSPHEPRLRSFSPGDSAHRHAGGRCICARITPPFSFSAFKEPVKLPFTFLKISAIQRRNNNVMREILFKKSIISSPSLGFVFNEVILKGKYVKPNNKTKYLGIRRNLKLWPYEFVRVQQQGFFSTTEICARGSARTTRSRRSRPNRKFSL